MSNYDLLDKEPISYAEVSEIIKKKEKASELTYREEKIREYIKKFKKLDLKEFEKARKELLELEIPRIEEFHIIKILDILPQTGTELRAIVSHSGTIIVDENVTKILDVLKKYIKTK